MKNVRFEGGIMDQHSFECELDHELSPTVSMHDFKHNNRFNIETMKVEHGGSLKYVYELEDGYDSAVYRFSHTVPA